MAGIRACRILDPSESKEIGKFINAEIDKGERDPYKIIGNFYSRLIDLKIEPTSRLVYLNTLIKLFSSLRGMGGTHSNAELSEKWTEVDGNLITSIYNQMDSAADTQAFIDENFVNPFLDDTLLEKKNDGELKKESGRSGSEENTTDEQIANKEEADRLREEAERKARDQFDEQTRDTDEQTELDLRLKYISPTEEGMASLRNKAVKEGQIAVFDEANTQIRLFNYNIENDTLTEVLPREGLGIETDLETFATVEFPNALLINPFTINPDNRQEKQVETNAQVKQHLKNVATRFVNDNAVTVFGNAMTEEQRRENLFEIDEKGMFILNKDVAKNHFDSKMAIFRQIFNGRKVIDRAFLNEKFGKDAKLFLEYSEDSNLKQDQWQIKIVIERKPGDKIVLGNYFNTDYKDIFEATTDKDGEFIGQKYNDFINNKIKEIKAAGGKLDITDQGLKVNRIFQPNTKSGPIYGIYQKDTDRYGKDQDQNKAVQLNMVDGLDLLQAMGFGVSMVYIDKRATNNADLVGDPFILVSPFHTAANIDNLLKTQMELKELDFSWAEFNREHNISMIRLKRKELLFEDYYRLIKDNDTVQYFKKDETPDYGKLGGMFNVGQSPYIHYRIGQSLEYMREHIDSIPDSPDRAKLEGNYHMLMIRFFSGVNFYGTKPSEIAELNKFKAEFNKLYQLSESGTVEIDNKWFKAARANYLNWKQLSVEKKLDASKELSHKLFGYYPADKDSSLTLRKLAWAKAEAEKRGTKFENEMKKGGVFSNELVTFFKSSQAFSSVKINEVSMAENWNRTDGGVVIGQNATMKNVVHLPTFNPTVRFKGQGGPGFSLSNVSTLAPLNKWDNNSATDVAMEYLILDKMPMMPHLEVQASSAPATSSSTSETGRAKRRRSPGSGLSNMTFQANQSLEYDLTESEALEVYNRLLGDIKGELELTDSLLEIEDGFAVGQVGKDIMRLHRKNGRVSERVLRHEIMHRVVNEALTPKTRRTLYQQVKKRMLLTAEHDGKFIQEISDTQADEFIAETYDSNYGNFSNKLVRNLPKILQDFYFFLKSMMSRMAGNENMYELIAERLESGNFVNSELVQDGYSGSRANKAVIFSKRDLAVKLNKDIEIGMDIISDMVNAAVFEIQSMMYGEDIARNLDNPHYQRLVGYKEIISNFKEELAFEIVDFFNDNLSATERRLFSAKPEIDDVSDLFAGFIHPFNHYTQLSENAKFFYRVVSSYKYSDEVIKFAVPFYNADNMTDENEASLDQQEEGIAVHENTEGNELASSKLRNSFERSEISSYGTFSEKVKFFLYNTMLPDSTNPVDRGVVDRFFREVFQRISNNSDSIGTVTIQAVMNEMEREVQRLSMFPNDYKYKSIKSIYDRFFNRNEPGSFISIALNTVPGGELQASEHQKVLTAILSAQKSVVEQHFLKVEGNKMTSTETSGSRDYKNKIKDDIVKRLFKLKNSKNVKSYLLSKEAKALFFNPNSKYAITGFENGDLQIRVNGKNYPLTKAMTNKGPVLHVDIPSREMTKHFSGLTDNEVLEMIKDFGLKMTKDAFLGYISKSSTGEVNPDKKGGVIALMVHSYVILAKQYMEENPSNHGFPKAASETISYIAGGRTDNLFNVTNENLRNDLISDSDESVDIDEKNKIYSPTALHQQFESLGAGNVLNNYDKKETKIYLQDGSIETVDKFPTAMHNSVKRYEDFLRKMENEFKLENDPDGAMLEVPQAEFQDYLRRRFGGITSHLFKNKITSGELKITAPLYFKAIRNYTSGRSKGFNDMTDEEFHVTLMKFVMGDSLNSDYIHPFEIQAARGFLPVMKVDASQRYVPVKRNGRFVFDERTTEALHNVRRTAHHHGFNAMREIYTILGDTAALQKLGSNPTEQQIKKAFNELDKNLDGIIANSLPGVLNKLTNRKHYVSIDGKFKLSPNLKFRINQSPEAYIEEVKKGYLDFAEYTNEQANHFLRRKTADASFVLDQKHLGDKKNLDDKRFRFVNDNGKETGRLKMALDDAYQKTEAYAAMSLDDKIDQFNPILMSLYTTYFINHNNIVQTLTGDPYLYKPDAVTGLDRTHSYMTDLSKRQGPFTTPKIEGVFREVLADGTVFNKNGIGRKLRVATFNDMAFNSLNDSKLFHEGFMKANNLTGTKSDLEGSKADATDGIIYTNPIFQNMLKESYGGHYGFKIGNLIKFNAHSFNPENGDLHMPKGLAQVITPQMLDMGNSFYLEIFKSQLKTAILIDPAGIEQNLWDYYESLYSEIGTHEQTMPQIVKIYNLARNSEGGYHLKSDIIHFMSPQSTEKGTGKGMNYFGETNPYNYSFADEINVGEINTDGFGVILDLQKDINKSDLDVSLSSQMMFLMGLNGKNAEKSTYLYERLKQMSNKEIGDIADDIANTFSRDNSPSDSNRSFLENKAALRKWFIKEIKNSQVAKSDYGIVFELVKSFDNSSISHPMLFEEIYSNIGSRISKSIIRRVSGFKAVQMPSHNMLMLYIHPTTGRSVTAMDLKREGIDLATVKPRNLKYSHYFDGNLTDTEIITGNIFAGKYGMDENLSLDQIFSIEHNGEVMYMGTTQYQDRKKEGRFANLIIDPDNVKWETSPVYQNMVAKRAFSREVMEGIESGAMTPALTEQMSTELIARVKEMDTMLYGVITRIPGTGKNSSTPVRIAGFIQGYENGLFTPAEWMQISGSDYDGDTVQLWNYDRSDKNKLANEALTRSRNVLKDAANSNEIFSMINVEIMDNEAAKGKQEMLKNGPGYILGSLKTVSEIKSNNAIGTALTGIHATQAKVHSYAAIGVTLFKSNMVNLSQERQVKVQTLLDNKPKLVFQMTSEETGASRIMNTGALQSDGENDFKDIAGNYIYKWNEAITNAAIDNPKYLTMKFSGLNPYNSSVQQAMTFLGFSPEGIIAISQNPIVANLYKGVSILDNVANDSRGSLKNVIKRSNFRVGETETVRGSDWFSNNGINEIKAYFAGNNFTVNTSDQFDVMRFLLLMEDIAGEIDEIRKFIKVTDSVPGKSGDQDIMIDNLIKSINQGITKKPEFNIGEESTVNFVFPTPRAILNFIKSLENNSNPLENDLVVSAQAQAYTTHPIVLMANIPHLRENLKRHLEFAEMKDAHLLYGNDMKKVRSFLRGNINHIAMRSQANRAKINRALYKFVNAVFLERNFMDYRFQNQRFNLGTFSGRLAFRKAFASHLNDLKHDPAQSNFFLNRLNVAGDEITFPGSENMQNESKVIPRESFKKLNEDLKKAFLLYEVTGHSNQLSFKSGSFVHFMDGETFHQYNAFLRILEKGTEEVFKTSEEGQRFMEVFIMDNPSLAARLQTWQVRGEEQNTNTFIGHSDKYKAKQTYSVKGRNNEKVNKFLLTAADPAKVLELETNISDAVKELAETSAEYKRISDNSEGVDPEVIKKQKEALSLSSRKIVDRMNGFQNLLDKMNQKIKSSDHPMFHLVKGYSEKQKRFITWLYKAESNPESKSQDHQVKVTKVFPALPPTVNPYSSIDSMPVLNKEKNVLANIQEFSELIGYSDPEPGVYFLTEDLQSIEILKDGTVGPIKKYSFRKGTPDARQKATAIASFVQKAFPNIKLRTVSGLNGVHGQAAGFVHNGTVFLNLDNIGLDTPIHEFGHILMDILAISDPALFNTIADMVMATDTYQETERKYKQFNNSTEDNVKEAFVTMLGLHAEGRLSEHLKGLSSFEKDTFMAAILDFVAKIKSMVNDALMSMGIRKQYINESLIEKLDISSDLNDMFLAIGGAIIQGEVITDMSTRTLNQLEGTYLPSNARASDAEVERIKTLLYEKGLIVNYCS
jgi:hypothetical protein